MAAAGEKRSLSIASALTSEINFWCIRDEKNHEIKLFENVKSTSFTLKKNNVIKYCELIVLFINYGGSLHF